MVFSVIDSPQHEEQSDFNSSSDHLPKHIDDARETEICAHTTVLRGKCLVCHEKMGKAYGMAFRYINEDLWLSYDEIARLRELESKRLLREKKLVLVLDLDHTLLQTTSLQKYLEKHQELLQRSPKGTLFFLKEMRAITKLRPFVKSFLKEASTMFEIYIYTMGTRYYARRMAKFLDPENVYFKSRIIAREDCLQEEEKTLEVVLKPESMVLILDDSEHVWKKHQSNLIRVRRYLYFDLEDEKSIVSLSALNTDERQTTGILATILKTLKMIHRLFFLPEPNACLAQKDVRSILERRMILHGCNIFFGPHIFPSDLDPGNWRLWLIAEELGAVCSGELSPSVTHVVTNDAGTEECRQAKKEKKFLVHPSWLQASSDKLHRQPEENFPIDIPPE